MAENEIIVRVENLLIDSTGTKIPSQSSPIGTSTQSVTLPSQASSSKMALIGGISAQLLISGATRMLGATGNQELAAGIRESAEYTFLGVRALAGDPTAIATMAFKLSAKAIEAITALKLEKEQTAKSMNELDMLKMRSGLITITANTEISYGKYGRLKLTDRK